MMTQNDHIVTKHKDLIVKMAAIGGALIGSLVPLGVYSIVHVQVDWEISVFSQPILILVLGGLLFSAPTVWGWSFEAFGGSKGLRQIKATGFVVLTEGMMTFVNEDLAWLSITSLVFLMGINAISSGATFMRNANQKFRKTSPSRSGTKKGKKGNSKKRPIKTISSPDGNLFLG